MPRVTFAVIIGNRDFFPDRLVTEFDLACIGGGALPATAWNVYYHD